MNDLLLIWRTSPFDISKTIEILDLALSTASVDENCAILWLEDGVFNLADLNVKHLTNRDISANFKALPVFGFNQLYACQKSCMQRNIKEFTIPLVLLTNIQIKHTINSFKHIITL